ncbi:uncharacterized protein LOC122718903 [Apis laboriosa]|uniref:uncharacterized protein LOC122718903 n=1 Tax=Apis laboriosa TaxID=183418 RepID=UPI001CC671E4|nr:uncharacterized protein LOC122718903 [Apis laboriosa]
MTDRRTPVSPDEPFSSIMRRMMRLGNAGTSCGQPVSKRKAKMTYNMRTKYSQRINARGRRDDKSLQLRVQRSDSPKWDNDRKATEIAVLTLNMHPLKTHRATESFVAVVRCYHLWSLRLDLRLSLRHHPRADPSQLDAVFATVLSNGDSYACALETECEDADYQLTFVKKKCTSNIQRTCMETTVKGSRL